VSGRLRGLLKSITMLKYLLSGSITLFPALAAYSQVSQPIKYKDPVFSRTMVEKDLSYSNDTSARKHLRSTLFDLYQPKEDSMSLRPLIIWMHGGGFKFGSKEAKGVRLWCETFASRGYVCAAINYRLGKKNLTFNFTELVKNCSRAVEDALQAITFFKNNCARFRIDTGRIVLAGNSAGGMIALQAAYSSGAELRQLQGSSDSNLLSHSVNPGNVAAVINFWGGIFNPGWLHNARVPIVSVHGRNDGIVPYDHKGSPLYGSLPIHLLADSLHIPNSLQTYDEYSHELQKHFNPLIISVKTKKRWLEAGQFAANFLYRELFAGNRY